MEMALGLTLKRVIVASMAFRRTSCKSHAFRRRLHLSEATGWIPHTEKRMRKTFSSLAQGTESQVETGTVNSSRYIVDLQEDLHQIFRAMGIHEWRSGEHLNLSGKTSTWGMQTEWYMKWCMDGRFYERFRNAEITQEWGHDGKNTWYADIAGRVLKLGMDEAEACLLTAWIRMGYWLTEEAQRVLEITYKEEASTATELAFVVHLKNKAVKALILVNRNTWLPVRVSFGQCRQGRSWDFLNWQNILPNCGIQQPILSIRSSPTSRENFEISNATFGGGYENLYSFPDSLMLPRNNIRYPKTEFDRSCIPSMKMIKMRTGHYVVRPLIDGREAGNFIVDTGTGTLAITQRMARQLGLSSFGEVNATSISGGHTLSTRFCRASNFQLGPLKIRDPVFVQIGIDKLLKGAEGLCGFDIFYNSIVEMSHGDCSLSLYDPSEYEAKSQARRIPWQRMFLYDRVPHMLAKINGREVLLMLDTGAAGPGLMFPSSAVHGFDDQSAVDMPATVGRGRQLYVSQAEYGNVQNFEIAGCSFKDLTALVPNKTGQQMGLSGYCAGVLCAEMVKHFTIVFDYANSRIAFIDRRYKNRNISTISKS